MSFKIVRMFFPILGLFVMGCGMLFDYDQSNSETSSVTLDCPDDFELIETQGTSSGFCISSRLMSAQHYDQAIDYCENQIEVNRGFMSNLCFYDQWVAACEQNPDKFVGGALEWVFEVPGVGNEMSALNEKCIDVPQAETTPMKMFHCCVSSLDRFVGAN